MLYLIRIIFLLLISYNSLANENKTNQILFKINENVFTNIDLEKRKEYVFLINNIKAPESNQSEEKEILNDYISALIFYEYYIENNISAFVYLLEECKKYSINKVIYASSSSVYGVNKKVPFKESDEIISLKSSYACSKKCMEVYGKYYNDVFNIKTIGLRFFTVYGERGRPDMAPYMFLKNIAEGKEINQFGDGTSLRDYTYITDISVFKPI